MNIHQLQKKLLLKELANLPLVNYEPASLKEWPTGWQIEFRVINPDTGKLEKKRLRFEKIRKFFCLDVWLKNHIWLVASPIIQISKQIKLPFYLKNYHPVTNNLFAAFIPHF